MPGTPCWAWLPPPCFSPWGRDTALDSDTWRSAPCASETSLADAHRESGDQSHETIRRGRPFGEQGSILCDQSRVQGRDPPVFSAGNTGKSQTTHSVSGPGRPAARGSRPYSPNHLPPLKRNLAGINQPASAPPPPAPPARPDTGRPGPVTRIRPVAPWRPRLRNRPVQ